MFHMFIKFTLIPLILFYPIIHHGESGYAKKFFQQSLTKLMLEMVQEKIIML